MERIARTVRFYRRPLTPGSLGPRALRPVATRLDSIIGTELRDTLWPIARFSGRTYLRRSPTSNPKVV